MPISGLIKRTLLFSGVEKYFPYVILYNPTPMASVLGSFSIERIINTSRPESPLSNSSSNKPKYSAARCANSSPSHSSRTVHRGRQDPRPMSKKTTGSIVTFDSVSTTVTVTGTAKIPILMEQSPEENLMQSTRMSMEDDSGSGKIYTCPQCGKIFTAHYNLTRHMPIHTGARPFICKVSFPATSISIDR